MPKLYVRLSCTVRMMSMPPVKFQLVATLRAE